MEKTKTKRSTILPIIRLTPAEKEQIKKDYLASPFTTQSAYVRYTLLKSGNAEKGNEEVEGILLLGSFADKMKVLSRHFVEFFRFKKEENNGQLSEEEAQFFKLLLKSIQEINAQFDKK